MTISGVDGIDDSELVVNSAAIMGANSVLNWDGPLMALGGRHVVLRPNLAATTLGPIDTIASATLHYTVFNSGNRAPPLVLSSN